MASGTGLLAATPRCPNYSPCAERSSLGEGSIWGARLHSPGSDCLGGAAGLLSWVSVTLAFSDFAFVPSEHPAPKANLLPRPGSLNRGCKSLEADIRTALERQDQEEGMGGI